jgi:hypothetical protein
MARPAYSLAVKAGGGGQVKSLIMNLHGMGLIAYTALTRKIQMPEKGKIVGIHLNVSAKGGTFPPGAATLDVQANGTTVLVAPFDVEAIVAGTPVDKEDTAIAAAGDAVAKDAVLSIVTAVTGGTSPTWQGADLQIDYVPLGD